MKDIEPVLYLITHYFSLFFIGIRECFAFPSTQLAKPDNYIFIDNDQGERFKHLSNWEIKVFTKAIPELSKFALSNMLPLL